MAEGKHVTVLIVDDDRGLQRLIQKALRASGLSATALGSGAETLEWLQHNSADLMVLDLKLLDMEGKELVERLTDCGKSLPFLVITGQGDERVAVEMMKRGSLDYLVKDAQFLELVPAVVNRALAQLDRDRKLKSAEEALRNSEERFRVALKNSPILVFSQDFELRYRWFHNPPDGYHESDFLGKKDEDLFSPDEAQRLIQIKREVLKSGFGARQEVKCSLRGVVHIYDLTVEPVRDSSGNITGLTGAAMDITDRKRLEQEISQISELEQHRIGQDLHDGICQHMAAIELMSQVLEQNLEKKSKAHAAQAGDIARHVRDAIAQTRSLARGLSPVVLESEGLMAALQDLAENTSKLFRVKCRFVCDKPVLVSNNTLATHLYRIAQEAVTNAIRHGKASSIKITLASDNSRMLLSIHDNGVGIREEQSGHKGMGLRIMQYRAGMIGGALKITRENEGTSVICTVSQNSPK